MIWSFSTGISAGLFFTSSNKLSSLWRRSTHGRTLSSTILVFTVIDDGGVLGPWLFPKLLCEKSLHCLFQYATGMFRINEKILNAKNINVLDIQRNILLTIFSRMASNQYITTVPGKEIVRKFAYTWSQHRETYLCPEIPMTKRRKGKGNIET